MNDRTISRGQEILRRVRCYKKKRIVGTASVFAALSLVIIACLDRMNGEGMRS